MKRNLAVIALTLLVAIPVTAAEGLQWETDWNVAFARARQEKKAVFVDFYATWCVPCKQMDARTFRDREVMKQLAEFVLLRINVDSSELDEKYRVRSFPFYSIRTPSDRTLYNLGGYHDAQAFRAKLDLLLKAMPEMLAASEALSAAETSANFMRLALAFDRATAYPQAHRAYLEAFDRAKKEGDDQTAQVALIEGAVARIKAGEVKEGIEDLHTYAKSPASSEIEAAIWLSIGFGEEARKDRAAAKRAYEKAASIAPEGSALRTQIDKKLSKLK